MHVTLETFLVITVISIFVNVSAEKHGVERGDRRTFTNHFQKGLYSTGFKHPEHWEKLLQVGKKKNV